MADIKFLNQPYYMQEASPFWLVWREEGHQPTFKHPSKASAETEAARIASWNPGEQIHVLGVLATIQTSPDIIGTRFDPSKEPPPPPVAEEPVPVPEFLEVDEPPVAVEAPARAVPAGLDDEDDDQPF